MPQRLAYKHSWCLSDPECRKRLSRANPRLDQFYLRKLQADPVELNYHLSIKRLLLVTEDLRRRHTDMSLFTTIDIEEILDPILFRQERNFNVQDIYNYYDEDNVDRNLRLGDAALFLDAKTKTKLRIEAQFRPSLHAIAFPSLEDVAETTDAEQVLNRIELSRQSDLLPTEQVRSS